MAIARIKKNDTVIVTCGNDAGKTGTVMSVNPKKGTAIVGGVNVITADNAQMCWSKRQYDRFKEEVAKGYPILIFTHCPVYYATPTYHDHMIKYGFTEEQIQLAYEVHDYLVNEPLIKGFFAGHCHLWQDTPYAGKPCYLTAALFNRELTEITID